MQPLALVGVASLTVLTASSCHHAEVSGEDEAPTSVLVRCVAPPVVRFRGVVSLRGAIEIDPAHHALVAPQVPGRVLSVSVREGDVVRRGVALAEIDARQVRDSVTQAEAAVAGARATEQNAVATAERTRRLFEHGIAARQETEDADARLASARSAVVAARAVLSSASRNLAFATVRAPIDGVVLRVVRSVGDLVDGTPMTPAVEVGDLHALSLVASALPVELVRLAVNQHGVARFEALPRKTYGVTVRTIAPAIDVTTGVANVRLALDEADGGLPPVGLAGEASVEVGARDGVRTIPASALRSTPTGGYEVLVCGDGHLGATEVHIGERQDDRVEVISGLADRARVVASGVLGLADGAAYREAP